MLIEVTETQPALPGRPTATVVASNGEKFDIWPNQLSSISAGVRYEVECTERVYKGRTYRKIVRATPINGASYSNGASHSNGNGTAKANGQSQAPTNPPAPTGPVVPANPLAEAEYVARALHALILKGDVTYHEQRLQQATDMLTRVWRNRSEERR